VLVPRVPSAGPIDSLTVVETEDIVVYVEVLRVRCSRHQEKHLTKLERIHLTLHLTTHSARQSNADEHLHGRSIMCDATVRVVI
jgi:hypothetical protein